MILKSEQERPRSGRPPFVVFGFGMREQASSSRAAVGKWETCFLVFHFSMAAKPGCGNVEISRCLRDFQGAVERVGKPLLLFYAFHGPGISTALPPGPSPKCTLAPYRPGGRGDSILHLRKSCPLAAAILRAHWVSLIFCAVLSKCAKLSLGFKYCSAFFRLFSFSYGVA